MTLQQLNYFCTIAQYSSFRRAAEELFTSQPTLSAAISALEKELGFFLFNRKGRHIELTKYGRLYYNDINPILKELHSATDKVKQMASVTEGHLDIAYIRPLSKDFISQSVRRFLDQSENTAVAFHFNQARSQEIVDGILRGDFDIGFCNQVPSVPHVDFYPVIQQELIAIVPLNHPLSARSEITLPELSAYPFIAYIPSSILHPTISGYLEAAQAYPRIIMEAEDEDAIAALVAAGFGVSFIAKTKFLNYADLVQIPIAGPRCQRTLYMANSTEHYLTPVACRFFHFMKELAEQNLLPEL